MKLIRNGFEIMLGLGLVLLGLLTFPLWGSLLILWGWLAGKREIDGTGWFMH